MSCKRQIGSEQRGNTTLLFRKIQGYIPIPPPEEAVEIEEIPEQVDIEEEVEQVE